MLISLKVNNCYVFNEPIEFSMRAQKSYKRFPGNVATRQDAQILKSAVILGPNNTGKTALTDCVSAIRDIMLNQPTKLMPYLKKDGSRVCELTMEFLQDDEYTFEVHFDTEKKEFVYERLERRPLGGKSRVVYLRDTVKGIYQCEDRNIEALMPAISADNILVYLVNVAQSPALQAAKNAIQGFASRIDVLDNVELGIGRTLEGLQDKDMQDDIREFVRNADLSLDDFRYVDKVDVDLADAAADSDTADHSHIHAAADALKEKLRLVSVYRGIPLPSWFFDSRGTKTIEALAGYVVSALREGRVLVIDELDSGLHFRLTRAIVALFNNQRNVSGQLIATTHDVMLLDCKRLFRKDQIWFTDKDSSAAYLYPLSDFTAREDGVRDTTDLISRYRAGDFGALPEPDLFPLLMTLEDADETQSEDASSDEQEVTYDAKADLAKPEDAGFLGSEAWQEKVSASATGNDVVELEDVRQKAAEDCGKTDPDMHSCGRIRRGDIPEQAQRTECVE